MTLATAPSDWSATTRLDLAIFALRSAPDWVRLDVDYSAGRTVDPAAYVPAVLVPRFPGNIAECIGAWNATFRLNYYRMRAELSRIAAQSRTVNHGGANVACGDLADFLAGSVAEGRRAAVFFCDDDDWFCPNLLQRVAALDWSQPAIKVFPLLRLAAETFTFARRGTPCAEVVGRRQDFHFRFQTNNYAIPVSAAFIPLLAELSDHIWGSTAADRLGLVDEYCNVIVSATNKTPCSASIIQPLLKDKPAFIRLVESYVQSLRQVQLTPETAWCAEPVNASAALFEAALG